MSRSIGKDLNKLAALANKEHVMPLYKMSKCEVFVPRYIGDTHNHVLVHLTLLHDRTDVDIHKEMLLQMAAEVLATWPRLPDKCDVTLSISDILLKIIEWNIEMVESWRFEHLEEKGK